MGGQMVRARRIGISFAVRVVPRDLDFANGPLAAAWTDLS